MATMLRLLKLRARCWEHYTFEIQRCRFQTATKWYRHVDKLTKMMEAL